MNIEKLFSGIGMVIDDQVFNQESSDKIIRIVDNTSVKIYRTKKLNNGSRVTGSAI